MLLAWFLGATAPSVPVALLAMALGLLGYGISLVLFVLALRGLGAARSGACFSTTPFMGAALALTIFGETASPTFWLAAALMVSARIAKSPSEPLKARGKARAHFNLAR